jgi:uncharacterized PurR-regulated membrane protein YhhQ (DUF165 family)
MKTILASIVTTLLIVVMTLAAMYLLVRATVYVTSLPTPLHRAVGMGAELVLGIVLLLGTTWLATHLAVRIFGTKETPPLPQTGLSEAASTAPSSAPSTGGSVV